MSPDHDAPHFFVEITHQRHRAIEALTGDKPMTKTNKRDYEANAMTAPLRPLYERLVREQRERRREAARKWQEANG